MYEESIIQMNYKDENITFILGSNNPLLKSDIETEK
jgi:hypothetical protein